MERVHLLYSASFVRKKRMSVLNNIDLNIITSLVKARMQPYSVIESYSEEAVDLFFETIRNDLQHPVGFEASSYTKFPTGLILEYLKQGHRFYLDKKIPEIELSISQFLSAADNQKIKGEDFFLIGYLFDEYKQSLIQHISAEEKTVFPYVSQLLKNQSIPCDTFRKHNLEGCATLMHFIKTHTDTEKDLAEIKTILNSYQVNKPGMTPFNLLIKQLDIFEVDLHIHSKIEEEVLVPMALEIEQKLLKSSM